ncbi:Na+/H+ antiporter [Leifsonia sp. LS1]|uniref:cation:proton antiporter n=1 Tax=Leifsonia sp. LS1 TaxID=2828483 RepID=UPI001CFCEB30|nr:sodium:proton antiporter [Leifsonia sp. LS1]GIT81806.1 Na+/H+ antiporter [Leifsonia sp. LS1]
MDPVATIVWIVSFVLVTVTVTGLSRRVGWSAPVVLVVVGAVASFIPGVPQIVLEPEVVLYGLLPPLLFAAAIQTSIVDVRARRDGILLLSVGLVAFTVVVVGFATWLVVPAITLAAAFAFGAVVAPTDTVAVTAIAGRVHLPRRLVTVLEGESLLNDATALVALNASIAAIVSVINPWAIAGEFGLAVVVGVGVGLVIGWVLSLIRKQLRSPVLDTSLGLITPYLAFIPSQLLHGSGILSVVVAGLYLGYRSPTIQTAEARIAETINWRTIQFLLENAVFLFIGLELSSILSGAFRSGITVWQTVLICVVVLVALAVARILWMVGTTALYRYGPQRLRERGWSWPTGIAVSFAGIRGVVTLAAVFLLPEETPHREFLQFLAFVVVVATLLEGLALPWIIRRLHLPSPDFAQEASEMQRLLAEAQTAGLEHLESQVTGNEDERVIERLRINAVFLSDALENPSPDETEDTPMEYRHLRRTMIVAERQAVLTARAEGRYQEPAVRSVLAFLDAEEAALKSSGPGGKRTLM